MEAVRPTFWNIPHWAEYAQYVLGALVVLVFAAGLYRRVRAWRRGRPEPGLEPWGRRLGNLVKNGLFQWRLASDPFAAAMHLMIFWGMVVLALGTALATIDWDVARLFFDFQFLRGGVYHAFELGLDLFGLLLIVGLAMAIHRRYVTRPTRLQTPEVPRGAADSLYLLVVLMLIAVTGFLAEGLRLATGEHPAAAWAPVGYALARPLALIPEPTLKALHLVTWWVHALLAFALIASIPLTKAFHMISSPLNLFLRNQAPPGRLVVGGEEGVEKLADFTWRQLLQLDACTWCGKCQEVCPAAAVGSPLSPNHVVQRLGTRMHRASNGSNGPLIPPEQLWACASCRACEEVCPVMLEQPRMIVDLRRRRVYEGEIDEGLQDALVNVGRYGNSFGQSPRKRAAWTKELDFPIADARKNNVRYLWFVGDYASYDPRAREVTKCLARVFRHADLDFGILHQAEHNAGNDVRRVGEEGLFELLREKNGKAFEGARFRYLVTSDPHTYNTLRNEYSFGDGQASTSEDARRPIVLHYTELLDELIHQRWLEITRPLGYTVTYHDPCYLGRYNGVYDPPRRILAELGTTLVEMPRNRENSFCCGAGGGRIWMKDTPGEKERPAENRIREALALDGVDRLVVACPKDLVMFQDAVKTAGAEERLRVVDLGELVFEALALAEKSGEDAGRASPKQPRSVPHGRRKPLKAETSHDCTGP